MHITIAWPSSAQQVACLCIILALQLPLISTCLLHMASYAIPSKLHFTPHPMTMLNFRSWKVQLTPIPYSLFHFCTNLARLLQYVQLVGLSQSKFVPFLLAHFYKATPNSPCKFNIILRSLLRHIRTNMPLTFSFTILDK